jgi:hypothetical protein
MMLAEDVSDRKLVASEELGKQGRRRCLGAKEKVRCPACWMRKPFTVVVLE